MSQLFIPDSFRRNVVGAFPNGALWLESLPTLIAEYEVRWQITCGPPFELSFNYVTSASTSNGQPVVLKLGVPSPELTAEIQALRLYSGRTAVRLLQADETRGVLLMERLIPGCVLSSISSDEHATLVAAGIMRKLWRPVSPAASFPTVHEWANGLNRLRDHFHGGTGPFPVRLVELAERLFSELLTSAASPVLLHGDLHHTNILLGQDGWVAIDPKGVIGEPAYEVAALLENPDPQLATDAKTQRRRLEILTEELNLDKERMLGYGIAHAVLSAWWAYEDSGSEWDSALACAETLITLMG